MNNNLSTRRSHHWLTREQRSEVKNLLEAGSRAEELAVRFDVHFNTIRNIGKKQSVTSPPPRMGLTCPIDPIGPTSKTPNPEDKAPPSPCAKRRGKGPGDGGSGNQANRAPYQSKTNPPIEESKNRRIEELSPGSPALRTKESPNQGHEEPSNRRMILPTRQPQPNRVTEKLTRHLPHCAPSTAHRALQGPNRGTEEPKTEELSPTSPALRTEHRALSTPQSPTEEPRNQKPKTKAVSQ